MQYLFFVDAAGLLLLLLFIAVYAVVAELEGPVRRWLSAFSCFADPEQTPLVRKAALRLGSRRRAERLRAVELLHDMRDRTAVPALLRAMEYYDRDAPLVEQAVHALAALGDPRALPALRRLTTGRNASLMLAAREAVAAMEPAAVLLRAAQPAGGARDTLLRPAGSSREGAAVLLRPGEPGG